VIDSVHYGFVDIGCWRRNDYFFGTCLQVAKGFLFIGKYTGAFKYQINCQFLPGKTFELALTGVMNGLTIDPDAVFGMVN
jgi:hypothetical protein